MPQDDLSVVWPAAMAQLSPRNPEADSVLSPLHSRLAGYQLHGRTHPMTLQVEHPHSPAMTVLRVQLLMTAEAALRMDRYRALRVVSPWKPLQGTSSS